MNGGTAHGRPLGIDLGTTYSAVGVVDDDGRSKVLHNSEGQTITPSVVLFDDAGAVVGQQAKLQRAAFADDVVEFVKRQMGDPHWRHFDRSGTEYTPEAVSAIILKRLAADASHVLGEPIGQVVITVPAYFDETQRNATRQAGAIAGLDVLAIVNEPTAAAVSFGVESDFHGTALVYDLGGGTFDVTLLRASRGEFDIIRTDGDRNLGGFDFDNAIMDWARAEFASRTGIAIQPGVAEAQLRDRAEQAKHRLTVSAEAPLYVTAEGQTEKLVLTRARFEEITASLLARTEMLVEDVLEGAGMVAGAVDKVLLVGGSTRMPMVGRMIERLLGRAADRSVHPDEAVARGAAIIADLRHAAEHGRRPRLSTQEPMVIADVVSHGLGLVTLDVETEMPVNTVLIPANTTIPCQRVETFVTVVDNQTELDVQITEGEERDLRYVKMLGNSVLRIPPYPKGAPVGVALSADVDGILHIEVTDQTSGRDLGEFEIDRQLNLDRGAVEQMRHALAQLEVQ